MMNRRLNYLFGAMLLGLAACGDDSSLTEANVGGGDYSPSPGEGNNTTDFDSGFSNTNNDGEEPFIPEEEVFLVRQLATTDNYVFIPNSSELANTVARVDANTLEVQPIRVGLSPTEIAATQISEVGAVAYVLCEGNHTISIIRADLPARTGTGLGDVRPLRVPAEVNALRLAPDGKHALAFIDPTLPFSGNAIASLQVLSLVRLADTPGEDQVFNLSVTRLIRDIEFTNTGEAFLVGQEGVNRIKLAEVTGDTLIPRLDLGLDTSLFPPTDFEVEVDPEGTYLVARSSSFAGVAVFGLDENGVTSRRIIELSGIPTDIDLVQGATDQILITIRDQNEIAVVAVDDALETPEEEAVAVSIYAVGEEAGLALLTPNQEQAVLYSTLPLLPTLSVFNFATQTLESWGLRNQIASVVTSPDSQNVVVVHKRQTEIRPGIDGAFQNSEGLTLVNLATGYRRPIFLQAEPLDVIMTPGEDTTLVYVMLASSSDSRRGVMRLDLETFRSDFVALPAQPNRLGRVGDKVFVSQESEDGRITFFDIETNSQRTISGYELNAGIE
ncbi:hypothetical protein FRD01_13840 [Microvenator marinus]|uniref:Alkaline phosphatase n=1 Tax=Microvenator marinus TaxID=2600177 RepID=A0A5B8XSR2_9DELT|nr:hypothetical protein [Microvenator marinus]QED28291.1 hypothetical protein FRD01_13840 [Microvenator marinus]